MLTAAPDLASNAPDLAWAAAATLRLQLEESGQREQLKKAFRERLVECGWRDEIAEQCRQIVKDQAAESGAESVTVQGIAEELFPVALSTVPDHVKAEILAKIRSAIIFSKNQ